MKIEILGTGCYNCIKLESLISEVLKDLGRSGDEIVRINNERQIRKYMSLDEIPGLVIDGQLINTRNVPDKATLAKWLSG